MMLTATACEANELVFASVHDSYWTHACNIDKMNSVLRDCFVRLHSQNIMTRLRDELMARFSDHYVIQIIPINPKEKDSWYEVADRIGYRFKGRKKASIWIPLHLPAIPKKGDFDIQSVRNSTYFFH